MIRQHSLGGPGVLVVEEVERPEPGPTEVLVRVRAAGVNPVDIKTRKAGGVLGRPPFTVGWDVSGVVEAVGRGVTRFVPGDEVFGMPRFPHPANAYAEYVTGPSRHFARKPAGAGHEEAGGLALAGLTAWQLLVDTAEVRAGQRVLVHAAAGGLGHLAVQVAKARGAYVIGTASAGKHEFLRGLGADELIDYREVDFAEVVRDVDVVIESIGGDYGPRSLRTLRRGGLIVTLTSAADPELAAKAGAHGVRAVALLAEPDHAGLERLAELVDRGRLKVHVAETFPLEEAAKAHELVEAGRVVGKVVLVPRAG